MTLQSGSPDRPGVRLLLLAAALVLAGAAAPAAAQSPSKAPPKTAHAPSWPGFRGPDGIPVSDNDRLPLHWSTTENVEWSVNVPGSGWSSPIVADGKVFLTTSAASTEITKQPEFGTEYSNEFMRELREQGVPWEEILKQHNERFIEFPDEVDLDYLLIAYSLEDGAEVWRRTFFAGPPPGGRHSKNTFASETPVTDGETIFVYITGLGLWAYTLDGELRWERRLDPFQIYMDFGTGGSPALTDDLVVVLNDNQEHQFLAAFSKQDGREVWRAARDIGPPHDTSRTWRTSWSTPFVWSHDDRTEIVALGPYTAISYDTFGRELWRLSGHSLLPVPTPFAYDGLLYVTSGVHGDANRPITAVRPGGAGDLTPDEDAISNDFVAWNDNRAGTYIPTPVPYKGALWVVYDRGIFARYDAATGERIFQARIKDSNGHFTTSPWAYRDRIFATDEAGTTFVFGAGNQFEQHHANDLDEMTLASPALAGDRLVMRTRTKLYSFREP